MLTKKYVCDHCGAELDIIKDFADEQVETSVGDIDIDLCAECYCGLVREIKNWAGMRYGYAKEKD